MTLGLLVLALSATVVTPPPPAAPASRRTIDEQIDRMSSAERIGQLIIVNIPASTADVDLEKIVSGWRVGGVVLYNSNLRTVAQVRQFTTAIRRAAGLVPPFIAVDQEGGVVTRLQHGVPIVPSNMALGATRSADLARRAGFAVGAALRDLGITMNFAPVLDVLPASGAADLQTRALSNDARVVADLGMALIEGQLAAGVIPVGKHFPGQGRAIEDTHRTLPILDVSPEDLRARDLVPFRSAIERGLPAIMTGHMALPRITGKNDLAATLSPEVMTNMLRKDLRFDGVAISDALEMKAVSHPESIGETAVRAVLAGCDMVLVAGRPQHREQVFDGLRRAHTDGRLTDARLRESLRRILALKATHLAAAEPIAPDIEREIARRAVTVIGDSDILATAVRETAVYVGPAGEVERGVRAGHGIILPPRFSERTRRRLREETIRMLAHARAWIAVAHTDEQWRFIAAMSASFRDLPLVYVNLGSPYRTVGARRVVSVLTYSSSLESQRTAVDVVKGNAPAHGLLPVTLPPTATGSDEPDERRQ